MNRTPLTDSEVATYKKLGGILVAPAIMAFVRHAGANPDALRAILLGSMQEQMKLLDTLKEAGNGPVEEVLFRQLKEALPL